MFGSLARMPKPKAPKKPKKIQPPAEHQQHIGGPYQSPVESYHSMLDQPAASESTE